MKEYKSNLPEIVLKYKKGTTNKFKIQSSQDAYKLFKEFYDQDTFELCESTIVLFLNSSNNTIGWTKHTQGGMDSCIIDVRLILATALQCGARSIMISHNHPSGNTHPSVNDNNITNKLKRACETLEITLLDHIIASEESYYSYVDNGMI